MKKNMLLLSAVAVMVAVIAGAQKNQPLAVTDVAVTASSIYCVLDGFCDQSGAATCQLSSTGTVFFRLQGSVCAVAATGKFHQ